MKQVTLILIKPDGLKRSLTGNILTRLSETKLEIVAAKMIKPTRELVEEHYCHMKEKPFFEELIRYLCGELHNKHKVMAMVYYGESAITKVRHLCGATNPEKADPTSIRGAYGRITSQGMYENVIHASENEPDAEREIKLWFQPDEIIVDLYPVKIEKLNSKVRTWASLGQRKP